MTAGTRVSARPVAGVMDSGRPYACVGFPGRPWRVYSIGVAILFGLSISRARPAVEPQLEQAAPNWP